ncbi:MAG: GGDEF domain-containing protein [Devosia sp.]
MLSAAAIDGGSVASRVAEARADTQSLRRLTLLILAALACTLFIFSFMLLASLQAVSMIDEAARTREQTQVIRYVDALPSGMNEITLDAMASTLGLRAARLTHSSSVGADEVSVSLAMGSDRVVAWTPQLLGTSTFEIVAPLRIGGGVMFVGIVGIIGWRVVSVSGRLDRRRAAAARLAFTDTLTGLGNRRAFDAGLESRSAIAAEGGPSLVLVMFDLDDFKAINDALGHSAGDAVLQIVGRHLRETAGRDDLVARIGGDEFAVVRDASGLDDYLAALDARFDQPIDMGGQRLRIGASIGMARSEDFPGAPARLIQAADIALYRAKRNGPGNAELAVPAIRHAA